MAILRALVVQTCGITELGYGSNKVVVPFESLVVKLSPQVQFVVVFFIAWSNQVTAYPSSQTTILKLGH
jgi:hypothetical protein